MNLAALKFRDFRIYLLGNIFALNGLWMQRLTIGWIAWDLTGSASFVGLVAFVNFVPTIIAGPFFGVFTYKLTTAVPASHSRRASRHDCPHTLRPY